MIKRNPPQPSKMTTLHVNPVKHSLAMILVQANEIKNDKERSIYLLGHVWAKHIKMVMLFAFHPNWESSLGLGETIDHIPVLGASVNGQIWRRLEKLNMFVHNEEGGVGNPNLSPENKQKQWLGFLGAIDPDSAKVMDLCKDQIIPSQFKNLTKKFIKELYPEDFPKK